MCSRQLHGNLGPCRIPGDQQIGAQRFEVIKMLTEELVFLLDRQTDKSPWDATVDQFSDLPVEEAEPVMDEGTWEATMDTDDTAMKETWDEATQEN